MTERTDGRIQQQKAADKELAKAPTISTMRPGDRGYTDPMALAFLRDGTCYLHGGYSVQAQPDAIARLLIERIRGGWAVHASELKHPNWRISRGLPWPCVTWDELMPVAKVL